MMSFIEFEGRAFCFTGKLAGLKRSQAERETRARGGLTTDIVNERLDYLVIGSIPSVGWKHGSFGTKIDKARTVRQASGRPRLVSEEDFVTSLGHTPATNSGAIDERVVVASYRFLVQEPESFDAAALESMIRQLDSQDGCCATVSTQPAAIHRTLFDEDGVVTESTGHAIVVECRIVRRLSLDEPIQTIIERISHGFEGLRGVDGKLTWFERTEGGAAYIRLLREMSRTRELRPN
jgi:hypothetical protein